LILITGGAGAVGLQLCNQLVKRGYRVRINALAQSIAQVPRNTSVEIFPADISDSQAVRGICDGVSIVVHLAAIILAPRKSMYAKVNVEGTQNILQQAQSSGVQHFIYFSSASVTFPWKSAYAKSKLAAEKLVQSSSIASTIVRPTLIYSEHGGEEFVRFCKAVSKTKIMPVACKRPAVKRPVCVDDVVDFVVKTIENAAAVKDMVLPLSGPQALSMRQMIHCIAAKQKRKVFVIALPGWLLFLFGILGELSFGRIPLSRQMAASFIYDADLDPCKSMQLLQWEPSMFTKNIDKYYSIPVS